MSVPLSHLALPGKHIAVTLYIAGVPRSDTLAVHAADLDRALAEAETYAARMRSDLKFSAAGRRDPKTHAGMRTLIRDGYALSQDQPAGPLQDATRRFVCLAALWCALNHLTNAAHFRLQVAAQMIGSEGRVNIICLGVKVGDDWRWAFTLAEDPGEPDETARRAQEALMQNLPQHGQVLAIKLDGRSTVKTVERAAGPFE